MISKSESYAIDRMTSLHKSRSRRGGQTQRSHSGTLRRRNHFLVTEHDFIPTPKETTGIGQFYVARKVKGGTYEFYWGMIRKPGWFVQKPPFGYASMAQASTVAETVQGFIRAD